MELPPQYPPALFPEDKSFHRQTGKLFFIHSLRDREPLHWPFSGMAVSQSSGMLLVICSVFNDYDRRIFAAFYRGRTTGQVRSAVG